jgi:TPP-dependent trihydroxycyclohexane-1,2-dione (THcHDO) dehydratase
MKRRQFNKILTSASSGIILSSTYSCLNTVPKNLNGISLAQWSLHKMIKIEKTLNPIDFAQKAKELGFNAIEYVSTLYRPELENMTFSKLTKKYRTGSKTASIESPYSLENPR